MTDTSEIAAYEASVEDHRNRRRDRKRVTKMVVDGAGVRRLRAVPKETQPSDSVRRRAGRNLPKR